MLIVCYAVLSDCYSASQRVIVSPSRRAIANSGIVYDLGIRRFDAALGGAGGCVTGAPGNQPTEELIRYFRSLGIETGIDEQKVLFLAKMVRRELYSKIPLNKD